MRIEFHRSFKKKYKKSDLRIRRRYDERLRIFQKDPRRSLLNNHMLSGDRKGQWSINITGDWRAIYMWSGKDTVIFLDIDTHGNLY